nr:GAP family protein [Rhodococcus sp. HNM0569]
MLVTPGAVVGSIILLQSAAPIRNALAFTSGFMTVYVMIVVAALLGGAGDPESTTPETSHGVGLVVGILLLLIGIWTATRRPAAGGRPGLLDSDDVGPRRALLIGGALGVFNPNIFIMASAVSTVAAADTSVFGALLATLVLLVAAVADLLIPVGLVVVTGGRGQAFLHRVQTWMLAHGHALTLSVLFGFGLLFTIRGVVDLTS